MRFKDNKLQTIIKYYQTKLCDKFNHHELNSIIYWILEDILGLKKIDILMNPDIRINESEILKINNKFKKIANQEPVQYVIGKTYFYNLILKVNKDVLIPRPETEELVNIIVQTYINKHDSKINILDIGTGSGCIAIALNKSLKNSDVTAIDISDKALNIAKFNNNSNNTNVHFKLINILDKQALTKLGFFDIIVSNPPYVLEKEKSLMEKKVLDFEPPLALFVSNEDPLIYYKAIINFALEHLNPNGKLFFEINENYGEELKTLLTLHQYKNISLLKDINNKNRFIIASLD
jgi:release factor glutamine methyltransferase